MASSKPEKPRIGKYTPELADDLVSAIRDGCPLSDACLVVGITTRTYRNWRDRAAGGVEPFVSLFSGIKKAKAERRREALENIRRAGSTQWQAAAWYLERSDPGRWAKPGEGRKDDRPPGVLWASATSAERDFAARLLEEWRQQQQQGMVTSGSSSPPPPTPDTSPTSSG